MAPYRRVIDGIKRLFKFPSTPVPPHPQSALRVKEEIRHVPLRIPRDQHTISRQHISQNALRVLYRLHEAGYQSFLVGGGVRDLLLGKTPKDFDVATNAKPDEVKMLFRNCRLIGRRFRLAHVHFGEEIVEVATFRAHYASGEDEDEARVVEDGRIVRDNVYGTFEEDAWRRDFTVNSLYYNIADFSVVDYTHQGMADLKTGTLRLIGDPIQRYREDPVRMLRALRFAAKLGFTIHPDSEAPLRSLTGLLRDIPSSRLFDEVNKLFLTGHGRQSLAQLRRYGVFGQLFPQTDACLEDAGTLALIEAALDNTDQRVKQDKSVNPAFLFAALLWSPLNRRVQAYQAEGANLQESLHQASHEVVRDQIKRVALPKRFSLILHEIWTLQARLEKRGPGKRALQTLHHPRFRAAYDFLALRAEADPDLQELADWWEQLYHAAPEEREALLAAPRPAGEKRPRRRRGGKRRARPAEASVAE